MALSEIEKQRKKWALGKFLDPKYSLGEPYDVFNQNESTSKHDLFQLRGILDSAEELGLDPQEREAVSGMTGILNQKVENYGQSQNPFMRGLRGFNQQVAQGAGTALDFGLQLNPKNWFDKEQDPRLSIDELREIGDLSEEQLAQIERKREERDSGVSLGDQAIRGLGNIGIGYGTRDERVIPSDYPTRAGQEAANVTPYMFGVGNMLRGASFNPLNFKPTPPIKVGTNLQGKPLHDPSLVNQLRRFTAVNPKLSLAGEAAGMTGFAAGVPYAKGVLEDPTSTTVEKIWAQTVPIITTGGAVVIPVLTKAVPSAVSNTLKRFFDLSSNNVANVVSTLYRKFFSPIDPLTGERAQMSFREAWRGGKTKTTEISESPSSKINPTRIANKMRTEIASFYNNIKTQIRYSPKGKGVLPIGKQWNQNWKQVNTKEYEEMILSTRKDFPEASDSEVEKIAAELLEKSQLEQKAVAKLNNIILVAKENPEKIIEEVSKLNKVLMKQQNVDTLDELIGVPSFVASGDDVSSQSPVLMALTNYEIKNSEPFVKKLLANTQNRREFIDKEIKTILGTTSEEYSALSVAEATKQANTKYDENIQKEIVAILDDLFARNKQLGVDDVNAGVNVTRNLRKINDDAKLRNNEKWNALKDNYNDETTQPFNNVREEVLRFQEQDFELINLPKLVKERVLRLITFNADDSAPIKFGEIDKLRKQISLAIRNQFNNPDADTSLTDNLIQLSKALNEDTAIIFPFSKDAVDSTRTYHNLFSRNNQVFEWVRKNNQGAFKQEESLSLEHLFGQKGKSLEGKPFALQQWREAIYGGSRLAYKDIKEVKETVNASDKVFKSIIAKIAEDSFDPKSNQFDKTLLQRHLIENRQLFEMFPENKKILKMYLKDISRFQKDLEDNVFGVANIEKDPITNQIKVSRTQESIQKAQLTELLENDNPALAIEGILLDEANGSINLMRLVEGVRSLKNPKLEMGLKSSIVEAIIRSGYIKKNEQITGTIFSQLFKRGHGANIDLKNSLKGTGLFTKKELDSLEQALLLWERELGAFENPALFQALKDVDPTNTMIDTFARVLAANFSTKFSTGAGAGLVIAGRFTRLAKGLLEDVKTPALRNTIQDLLLDSAKFELFFNKFADSLDVPLGQAITKAHKAKAFVRIKSALVGVGIELNYPDFEKAWDEMTYEERLTQGQRDSLKYGVQ